MTLLVATTNVNKVREIRAILVGRERIPVRLISLADLPAVGEPEETGDTFCENARLKALYYGGHFDFLTVAEDSGLIIDALDGEPGVRSARFLGPDASYAQRFAEIYRRLAARPDAARTARFICAVAVVGNNRVMFETTGTVEGEIAPAPTGSAGFGYDPIFFHPPSGGTLAEVTDAAKLAVSHRGEAFGRVAEWLRNAF